MNIRYVKDIAVLIVVILTAWAAISTQRVNNELQEVQERSSRTTVCTEKYLARTISALNVRTTYTQQQAQANVELQRGQSAFLATVLRKPPATEKARDRAIRRYYALLTSFVEKNDKAKDALEDRPYPTNVELITCLNSD